LTKTVCHTVLLTSLLSVLLTLLSTGNWRGLAEVPEEDLESAERHVKGEEKAQFLDFARKMLKWKPEERSSAKELLEDPWLNSV
jgi:serine/threonine-protein kinase SRPK3